MSERYTEYECREDIKRWFVEALEYDWKEFIKGDFSDADKDAWTAKYVLEEYEYNGRFHEIVDGCVPVYNHEIVTLWLDLNMPEAAEYGDENVGEIIRQMMVGIYYWADEYARKNFEDWHNEVVKQKEEVNGVSH